MRKRQLFKDGGNTWPCRFTGSGAGLHAPPSDFGFVADKIHEPWYLGSEGNFLNLTIKFARTLLALCSHWEPNSGREECYCLLKPSNQVS